MYVLQDKKVKARKDHVCNFCGMKIKKGEKYNSQVNKSFSYGAIYNWKSHIKCTEIAHKLNMYDECDDEGLTSEIFWEYIEMVYHEMYGDDEISRDCDDYELIEKLDRVCDNYLNKEIRNNKIYTV